MWYDFLLLLFYEVRLSSLILVDHLGHFQVYLNATSPAAQGDDESDEEEE